MQEISIIRKQPLSLGNDSLIFKVGEEENICVSCDLPAKKCNGDCKRFREEKEKLKKNGHCKSSNKHIERKTKDEKHATNSNKIRHKP